ncbi:high affinity copper uptake protein 1 [Calliphora vicina]|uniref:high affinity copper uptake protein 1 n=1 Tax=Calliphora vicina TaxID=7373 RepID=UPI00325BC74C
MDHDHGGMGGGDDMDGSKSCPMIMTFHAGHCERILWNGWVASTVTEFVFSALALFLVAFLYEALKFVREYFLRQTVKRESERVAAELQSKNGGAAGTSSNGQSACHGNMPEIRQKTYMEKIFAKPHIIQSLFNLVQIIISYLLMLVFMTFNYWLCLAVVLGLGVGYFFFGWIKQDVYESECCH